MTSKRAPDVALDAWLCERKERGNVPKIHENRKELSVTASAPGVVWAKMFGDMDRGKWFRRTPDSYRGLVSARGYRS